MVLLLGDNDNLPIKELQRSFILSEKLRKSVIGDVFSNTDPVYNVRRAVKNGGCHNRPLLILTPLDEKDVAVGVKFAREEGLEISVRSGGHSYTCTSSRAGGLHFDLRRLDKVELVEPCTRTKGWTVDC